MAQLVKNLPALQETCIQSLSREDPLEKETATHCSILAWRTPWTEAQREGARGVAWRGSLLALRAGLAPPWSSGGSWERGKGEGAALGL